jgi:4-amino-4-deoxy-L-arabinose transferase-like glycosyltransferase
VTTLVKKDRGRDAEDVAAHPPPGWSALDLPRPAIRGAVYALLLAVAAGWLIFHHLGAGRVEGDEAFYALCTDNMRAGGEWLTPMVRPPHAYLNKPPLYMWLSAATYRIVPGFEEKYRFWSAAAGVGCVVMTCLLGWALLGPEVGAVAGALLLTNREFLFEHGARSGTMDTSLTLLMGVTLLLYWLVVSGRIGWGGWIGIGIAAGLACLLKPFFGLPMLVAVAALAVLARGSLSIAARVRGMCIALVLMMLVAGPWYALQWRRHGARFTETMRSQVLRRATTGLNPGETSRKPLYYVVGQYSVTASSAAFRLFVPALLFCAGMAAMRSPRRQAYALPAVVGIGWLAVISWSKGRFLHYAYPAFPAVSVALAALFVAAFLYGAQRLLRDPRLASQAAAVGFAVGACAVIFACARLAYYESDRYRRYVPWQVYQTFRPALGDGRVRLIACGLPGALEERDESLGLLPSEMFYLAHMEGITHVANVQELAKLLESRTPTVLLLSRRMSLAAAFNWSDLVKRADERFTGDQAAISILAIDTDPLLRPRLSDGSASRYVQLLGVSGTSGGAGGAGGAFSHEFTVRVTPPLPEDFLVEVMVRRTEGVASETVRCDTHDGDDRSVGRVPLPFVTTARLTARVNSDSDRPSAPRDVKFRLMSLDERHPDEPIRGVIEDVQIIVQPRLPIEKPATYLR